MNVHVLQHIHCEGPGAIATWALGRGATISTTRLDRGDPLPDAASVDLLVIMGGPMNIYQDRDHPWLRGERDFIAAHVGAGRPAVGVCLGSQFLADALGARVVQNPHVEIGVFPVDFTAEARNRFPFLPESLAVAHWHGDTFDLPAGAMRLASTPGCLNQGFLHGVNMLGLQFHPEVTRGDLAGWLEAFDGEPADSAYVQRPDDILATPDEAFISGHAVLGKLLDAIIC